MIKIKNLEFCGIILMILISSFFSSGVNSLIKTSQEDAARIVLISMVFGFIIIYMFLSIFNYKDDLNIKDKINSLFKKPFNYIINIILGSLTFILLSVYLYSIISFIISQFLTNTPTLVIGIIFIFIIIYINICGIENISKTCFILLILNLISYLISIISLTGKLDTSNLKPIFKDGIPYLGILYSLATNILPIFILLCIPKDKIENKKISNKYIIITYILSILIIFITTYFIIGVLGIDTANTYQYPGYITLENVNLFIFLNKLENILNIQWIFGLFISCSIYLFYITSFVKKTNKKISILGILSLIFSILFFKDTIIFNKFIFNILPYIFIIIMGIHIIIFLKIKIDKLLK